MQIIAFWHIGNMLKCRVMLGQNVFTRQFYFSDPENRIFLKLKLLFSTEIYRAIFQLTPFGSSRISPDKKMPCIVIKSLPLTPVSKSLGSDPTSSDLFWKEWPFRTTLPKFTSTFIKILCFLAGRLQTCKSLRNTFPYKDSVKTSYLCCTSLKQLFCLC